MRRAHADYEAIEAALEPHQLRTIREYAITQRVAAEEWSKDAVCCALANALAVQNLMRRLREEGLSERRALARVAAEFDLDYETLQRHRRSLRRRDSMD